MTRCPTRPFPLILVLGLVLTTIGCAGRSATSAGSSDQSESQGLPELSDELIKERINTTRVRDVPPESGTGAPIPWSFAADEPKEITIIDKQVQGPTATVVLDIKTQSSPRAKNLRTLAGQIRIEWALRTGWVLRRWEIVRTENISMKYRDVTNPPDLSPNR